MLKGLYSIYDEKTQVFGTPFASVYEQEAIRHLAALCLDDRQIVCLFPSDFRLYRIGQFDDITGLLTSLPVPQLVASAVDIKAISEKGEL